VASEEEMAYKTLGASSTTLFTAQLSAPATRRFLRRFNVHNASIIPPLISHLGFPLKDLI
jgi:hypothetical protein